MKHLILIILSAPLLAFAQACGVGGTALSASGVEVTRTNEEATRDSVRVGADGYWWRCQIKAPSVDLPCRLSGGVRPTWYGDDGTQCVANEVIRGPLAHGTQVPMMATQRGVIGYQRVQCDDGILVSRVAWCRKR